MPVKAPKKKGRSKGVGSCAREDHIHSEMYCLIYF